MRKVFLTINILSLCIYPAVFLKFAGSFNYPPYLNIMFLLFVSLLFLSARIIAYMALKVNNVAFRKLTGYLVAIFPLIFPLSGITISAITQDKRQIIPYVLFQGYYFLRFLPIINQLEVDYHV